jgi:hypothetical protein
LQTSHTLSFSTFSEDRKQQGLLLIFSKIRESWRTLEGNSYLGKVWEHETMNDFTLTSQPIIYLIVALKNHTF